MPTSSAPDWQRIEQEYRVGQLSIKEIARQHAPLSDTAIRKRAKALGWTRDLSGAVRTRVRESLVREEVRANQSELMGVVPSEAAIVDAAAARGVEVVRSHRVDIDSLRKAAATLLAALGEGLKVTERSRVIADLSQAMARLVPLERQAFGLDEDRPDGSQSVGWLSDSDLAEMIHALKSQLAASPPARSGASEARKQEPA